MSDEKKYYCPHCGQEIETPNESGDNHCVNCGGKMVIKDGNLIAKKSSHEITNDRQRATKFDTLLDQAIAGKVSSKLLVLGSLVVALLLLKDVALEAIKGIFALIFKGGEEAKKVLVVFYQKAESILGAGVSFVEWSVKRLWNVAIGLVIFLLVPLAFAYFANANFEAAVKALALGVAFHIPVVAAIWWALASEEDVWPWAKVAAVVGGVLATSALMLLVIPTFAIYAIAMALMALTASYARGKSRVAIPVGLFAIGAFIVLACAVSDYYKAVGDDARGATFFQSLPSKAEDAVKGLHSWATTLPATRSAQAAPVPVPAPTQAAAPVPTSGPRSVRLAIQPTQEEGEQYCEIMFAEGEYLGLKALGPGLLFRSPSEGNITLAPGRQIVRVIEVPNYPSGTRSCPRIINPTKEAIELVIKKL